MTLAVLAGFVAAPSGASANDCNPTATYAVVGNLEASAENFERLHLTWEHAAAPGLHGFAIYVQPKRFGFLSRHQVGPNARSSAIEVGNVREHYDFTVNAIYLACGAAAVGEPVGTTIVDVIAPDPPVAREIEVIGAHYDTGAVDLIWRYNVNDTLFPERPRGWTVNVVNTGITQNGFVDNAHREFNACGGNSGDPWSDNSAGTVTCTFDGTGFVGPSLIEDYTSTFYAYQNFWNGSSDASPHTASIQGPPRDPRELTIDGDASSPTTGVVLRWRDMSAIEDGFNVYRKLRNAPESAYTKIGTADAVTDQLPGDYSGSPASFLDTTAALSTDYDYRVTAFKTINGVARESRNPGLAETTFAFRADAPDLNPAIPDYTTSTPRMSLSWVDRSTIDTNFEIWRKVGTDDYGAVPLARQPDSYYQDTAVEEGATYTYKVRATNHSGWQSGFSTEQSATIRPTAPTGFEVVASAQNVVQLRWVDNSARNTGYQLYRYFRAGFGPVEGGLITSGGCAGLGAAATGCTDDTVVPGREYFYQLQAAVSVGASPMVESTSADLSITTPAASAPAAPTNLRLVGTPAPNDVRLAWTDNANDETGFVIERAGNPDDAEPFFSEWGTEVADAIGYWDFQVSEGGAYGYRVKAVKQGSSSPYAGPITVRVKLGSPSDLRVGTRTTSGVALSWQDGAGAEDGYAIERSVDGGATWAQAGTVGPVDDFGRGAFTDHAVTADGSYKYRVKATKVGAASLDSEYSNVAEVGAGSDDEGVDDAVEDGAPNGGDGNGDGVPDRQQPHVTSLPNAASGGYVTLVGPPGTTLLGVQAQQAPPPGSAPDGATFPIGTVAFRLGGVQTGAAVTVELLLPPGVTPTGYYKRGPTPGDPSDHWYAFDFDGTTGAQFAPGRVSLRFVDGLRGDADLAANGSIVDPGGPGVVVTTISPTRLAFSTQPGGAVAGTAFTTQPVVRATDDGGRTATAFNGPITMALKPGSGTDGASLGGTLTVNAVNGVATFGGLSLDLVGSGYRLLASAPGLAGAESAQFEVAARGACAPPPLTAVKAKAKLSKGVGTFSASVKPPKGNCAIVAGSGTWEFGDGTSARASGSKYAARHTYSPPPPRGTKLNVTFAVTDTAGRRLQKDITLTVK